MRREPSYVLVASLLSIVATLIGVIITEKAVDPKYTVPMVYIAEVGVLAALAYIYARTYLHDLRDAKRDLHVAETVFKAVPTLVAFRSRTDVLTVSGDGNATLRWAFELSAPKDVAVPQLTFPVFAEVDAKAPQWSAVSIESIRVNGQPRGTAGAFVPIDRRFAADGTVQYVLEYGLLHVPVELGPGLSECRVELLLRFSKVFPKSATAEVFYVDIPYLTERLLVQITAAEAGHTARKPLGHGRPVIEAMSEVMEVIDAPESSLQSDRCNHQGALLEWATDSPKLGYRYKIYFRLENTPGEERAAASEPKALIGETS